ncbi:hypothetical protein M609_gp054 [Mycobacterium phage Job42]|uniref:Uncharacterized protein n=2 Tax=Cheoctovirus TaxID=1623281 RepID=Q19YK5_9CAUD|nr:hypothetical protein BOOMER_56 [Mycobacterium phage Boomer]YP_008126644.1 hypothetical protein M609_gp054 [Mycobacterium phage Job42]YP_655809.1 gp48 [Mycobacterium phage PMC]UVK61649.1 hypothetical protein SEA_ROCKNE_52 [Mycobacterium phage Rockne]ABE67549.1 hypothetical protein PBI_PMC_48 [Mycobacterium phage PMC]ACF34118.1 hypothetical protein BOOMER_56 [Mycobacterium phage Boomer]AGM61470.1 hypothetical protein PBI_JOB42_54 [Mycobacterium phage Job42]
MNQSANRQVIRQIEKFLEDGDRNRLTVALAILDLEERGESAGSEPIGQWSVQIKPGCESHVRLALTDVYPDGVNEIEGFLDPDTARRLAAELVDHATWCQEWISGMHRDEGDHRE